MADIHLGGWKQQPLQDLNLESFKMAIESCINEKVEFVLMAGDIFDSAFPPNRCSQRNVRRIQKIKRCKNSLFHHRRFP